jgi:ParB/RepB/Spo0J family partition protein
MECAAMKVLISQIKPNPFQVRKQMDPERVQALADEIKELGYWGELRGRKQGANYELCFGHRRLEALKLLKIKEVDFQVVPLSDEDMATQALVENLQREGLTDIEKAEGIDRLMNQLSPTDRREGIRRVAKLMGFSSEKRVDDLLSLIEMTPQSQRLIAQKHISGQVAIEAQRFGGESMIETAAKHDLPLHTLRKIRQEVEAIPEPKIQERVKKAVIAGRVRDPESVREQGRKIRAAQGAVPRDLRLIIRQWTQTMEKWNGQLDEVFPYLDYIEGDVEGAKKFKTAARELIEKLKRFL